MSIFTEFKKFNRKYVIVTSMDDTALPADSEVLLEGVTVIYTATGEVKDASKCKVGDGSTTFGILPWIGARDVVAEDLREELQRQDELLTSIEALLGIKNGGTDEDKSEAMWYFTYNIYPDILRLENGKLVAGGDPWGWTSTDGTHTFDISPLDGGIALQNLDTSKVYKCINDAGSPGDYAELVYGVPEKAWRLFATEAAYTNAADQLNFGWNWPYIKDGILYSNYLLMAIYKNTGSGLGDYISTLDGSEETPYTFSLENLSTTETYNIYHDEAADYVHTFTLKYDYPANLGEASNGSNGVRGVVVEFPTEWANQPGYSYPANTILRLSVGADTKLDADQITIEFFDRYAATLGTKTFTVASGTSVEFDFEGFGGESFNANGEHSIMVTYSIDGETFTSNYSANWP